MPIPVLSKIFMQECQHLKLPELSVFSNTAAAEDIVPDKNTTISKSGGKGMFSTVKAKVIAGVVALAVVGGGITAVVLANRDKTADADKPNTAVQTDTQGEVNEQEIEDKLNDLMKMLIMKIMLLTMMQAVQIQTASLKWLFTLFLTR